MRRLNGAPVVSERPRGRPRREELTDSILETALDLLATKGFKSLRLEDVAAQVGTSKQALYRRWPSKPALVAAAIQRTLAKVNPEAPNTGDARRDLVVVLSKTFHTLETTPLGGAIRAMVGETGDPERLVLLQQVEKARRKLLYDVLKRAVPRRTDIDLDIDLLLGTGYFRFLLRRVPLGNDLAARAVNALLGKQHRGPSGL